MRLRSARGPRRVAVLASLLVLSVGCLAGCVEDRAARGPSSPDPSGSGAGAATVRVLQMNLCNSGRADCYSGGRAVSVARALMRQERPDMVSLNEVCREDVDILEQAMAGSHPGARVAVAFRAAVDRPTMGPVRCQNGQEFGDGVLAVLRSGARPLRTYSGIYPRQDPHDVEERVWVCLASVSWSYCSTHAASTDTATALAQCRYVIDSTVRTMHFPDGGDHLILAGDLNIGADVRSCLPPGFAQADDGAVQHVLASPGLTVRSSSVIDMQGATDHPGLLVELVEPRR